MKPPTISTPRPQTGFSFTDNLRRHKWDLLTTYRAHSIAFLVSALVDAASTTRFMALVGPEFESNFYVRTLTGFCGIVLGPLLGKLLQCFALWGFSILAPRLTRTVCLVVIAINFTAALINFVVFG